MLITESNDRLDDAARARLSKLQSANDYVTEKRRLPKRLRNKDQLDALALRFGMARATLDRWVRVLQTPGEVQATVVVGQLTLDQALDVSRLLKTEQALVAARIRAGEAPADVVRASVRRSVSQTAWNRNAPGAPLARVGGAPEVAAESRSLRRTQKQMRHGLNVLDDFLTLTRQREFDR